MTPVGTGVPLPGRAGETQQEALIPKDFSGTPLLDTQTGRVADKEAGSTSAKIKQGSAVVDDLAEGGAKA